MVGVAELPVENTLVCTSRLGIAGVAAGRFGFAAAIWTFGAWVSSTLIFGLGVGDGSRRFSGIGVLSCATGSGTLNSRTGAG